MLQKFIQWLIKQSHPRAGTLAAYGDGELGSLTTKWVERHVQMCSPCRQDLQHLGEGLSRFQLLAQPIHDDEILQRGWENLQQAMRDLVQDMQPPLSAKREWAAKRRFFAELEVCLGERAAGRLLDQMAPDNRLDSLLAAALPTLTALLGRKTADAIVARTFSTASADSGAA